MSLYSEGGIWKLEWQRVKGFCFVSSCLWKPFEVLSPVYRAQHWEKLPSSPCLFFSRRTCLCCSENCCTVLGPPSRHHPSTWLSMNTFCSTQVLHPLLTLLSCSWRCMEMERGPVQRGEQRRALSSLLFWNHSELSLYLWKKKNLLTLVICRDGLLVLLCPSIRQQYASQLFRWLCIPPLINSTFEHSVGPLLQNHEKYNLFKTFFSDTWSLVKV